MPRRLLGVFILLLVSVPWGRAQGDVVLLTVGGEAVSRSEFEYHLGKSQEKREDVFAETYARFKQKVLASRDMGLDTLPEVRRQMAEYRARMDGRCLSKDKTRSRSLDEEWIRLVHVTYGLKQSAGRDELQKGKRYMDSLYAALKGNADAPLVEMPWTQTRHLLDEWQGQLEGLARGVYSEPFLSPMGIHIIAWKEKLHGGLPVAGGKPECGPWRMKEVEEGLLVAALEAYWERVSVCTDDELETFFKKHRADYGGGTPHFKGAVIHCRDKKEAKAIRKYLKGYPEVLWKAAVERMPEEVSAGCRIETGLFAIGANPYIDKLVFKCNDIAPLADYPYTWVLGKKLKRGPTDYRDVRPKLEKDCRKVKKEAEMNACLQKYEVEIDKEVLKTVNRAEN